MTDHDQTRWEDAHALSGAYAVDALDADERARFEAHLELCVHCREEVDGLREAASLLGIDDAVAPPPALRDQVLAGIGAVRPLPPLAPEQSPEPDLRPAADLGARRRRRGLGGTLGRVPLLVAAALVLVAVVGTAWLRPWADEQVDPGPRLTVAEQVLADETAQRVDKRFPDGSKATIVRSERLGRAVIVTEDMPPAPHGHDYELWFQTPAGEMVRAGLMPDVRDATYVLEGDATRAVGVGITVEPDGGSEQPTTPTIAFFPLDA